MTNSKLLWLRQLLEWQQEVRDPQEFLQNLKIDLYPEEVYIFTRREGEGASTRRDARGFRLRDPHRRRPSVRRRAGERQDGSAPHPAAERRHRGNRDHRRAQAEPRLAELRPTSRARNKIKHFIHAEEKIRSLELRRKLFAGGTPLRPQRHEAAEGGSAAVLTEGGYQKPDELFTAIAYGKLSARAVLAKLVPQEQLKEPQESTLTSVVKRVLGTGEEDRCAASTTSWCCRARCCNPIRGEKIVGYITRGKGVSVHSATCTNVLNLLYDPERGSTSNGQGPDALPVPSVSASRSRIARSSRRRQLEDRRHQHQHPQRRGHDDRDDGPHRHDRGNQRREAPAEGDQVAEMKVWWMWSGRRTEESRIAIRRFPQSRQSRRARLSEAVLPGSSNVRRRGS